MPRGILGGDDAAYRHFNIGRISVVKYRQQCLFFQTAFS